jgi:hypothetical protein
VTPVGLDVEPTAGAPPDEEDFYERTRFWRAAKRYGFTYLLITWGSVVALAAGGGVLWLYLAHHLPADGLKALGLAYVSLGAALFGIVLAGLAVVAAFFDREYVEELRSHGRLDGALFGFWWVAALAVVSVLASVALTVAAYASASRAVTAVAVTIATVMFVDALVEALTLVGTMMRHGLYRAETAARGFRIKRGTNQ